MLFPQASNTTLVIAIFALTTPAAAFLGAMATLLFIILLGDDPVPAARMAMFLQTLAPHFPQQD